MKNFLQWCEETEKTDMIDVLDMVTGQETTSEQRARTGWSANYPPAYFSAQYPKKWMAPRKATHDLDAEQLGRKDK